jgi:hypothetical protein
MDQVGFHKYFKSNKPAEVSPPSEDSQVERNISVEELTDSLVQCLQLFGLKTIEEQIDEKIATIKPGITDRGTIEHLFGSPTMWEMTGVKWNWCRFSLFISNTQYIELIIDFDENEIVRGKPGRFLRRVLGL